MKSVTGTEFHIIKKQLRFRSAESVARKNERHLSTIINIKGSKNYEEYKKLVESEHQPVKYSLMQKVLDLHKIMFDNGDNKYIAPTTAKMAIAKLLEAAEYVKETEKIDVR